MAKAYKIHIWKKAPFLRILLPFIAGIILEVYFKYQIFFIGAVFLTLVLSYIIFRLLPLAYRFKFQPFFGIIVTLFMINAGFFITWQKDVRHQAHWYGNYYDSSSFLIAIISEPPIEKNKSYKALATVAAVTRSDSAYASKGNLLLYFAKDSLQEQPAYGDKILIKKQLVAIKNSGNPAAFDYERYCAFQQIFHQCNLKKSDWVLLKGKEVTWYSSVIFTTRQFIVDVLNKYIGGKEEAALANALLIGYKLDLDKDLVQAYTNAGRRSFDRYFRFTPGINLWLASLANRPDTVY